MNRTRLQSLSAALYSQRKLYRLLSFAFESDMISLEAFSKIERKGLFAINSICEAGCHDCCSEYFYVSKAEYLTLRNKLIQNKLPLEPVVENPGRCLLYLSANIRMSMAL